MYTERHQVWRRGLLLGEVDYTLAGGWFAMPHSDGPIQRIPCTSGPEAVSTVERLGTARIKVAS